MTRNIHNPSFFLVDKHILNHFLTTNTFYWKSIRESKINLFALWTVYNQYHYEKPVSWMNRSKDYRFTCIMKRKVGNRSQKKGCKFRNWGNKIFNNDWWDKKFLLIEKSVFFFKNRLALNSSQMDHNNSANTLFRRYRIDCLKFSISEIKKN